MYVSPDEGVERKYTQYPIEMTATEVWHLEQIVKLRASDYCTYRGVLKEMFETKSKHVIDNSDMASASCEIKYILNRIAANQSYDKIFNLTRVDNIKNGDKWAPLIAKAFQGNTFCTDITLQIGLSDTGAEMILNTLQHNQLDELNLTGNNFTGKTFSLLNDILCKSDNRWKLILLDRPQTENEGFIRLKNNPKVQFEDPYTPPTICDVGHDVLKMGVGICKKIERILTRS